jgi:hypothetical protein
VVTLEEMRERMFRLLGESTTEPQLWTEAQADRYLNDAYQEVCRDTGALEIREGIVAVDGQWTYTLPDRVGPVMRVAFDDYELKAETARSMDRLNPGWQTEEGTPERWIKSREGYNSFKLWRAPSDDGATAEATIDYGKPVDIEGTLGIEFEFNSEVGTFRYITGTGISFKSNSEYGRLTYLAFSESNIEVWAKKVPEPLEFDDAVPELPPVLQMGVVFRAAEKALELERDGRNEDLAKVYGLLADEYVEFGRALVNRRMPERVSAPRASVYDSRVHNFYRDTAIPAAGLPGVS